MTCHTSGDLQKLLMKLANEGKVADYIPALAEVNKQDLSVVLQYILKYGSLLGLALC